MNDVFTFIGMTFATIGGCLFALAFLVGIAGLACETWVSFSNRFRNVCKAESLIREYRKNREEFLEWKLQRENNQHD